MGEARRLLGPLGWTIPYRGVVDRAYPSRLAERIERWAGDPGGAGDRRRQALDLWRSTFDPEDVRERVHDAIATLLK